LVEVTSRDSVESVDHGHLVSAPTHALLEIRRYGKVSNLECPALRVRNLYRRLQEHYQLVERLSQSWRPTTRWVAAVAHGAIMSWASDGHEPGLEVLLL